MGLGTSPCIDGSLGVSFLYIFLSFKQQAWVKGILYALLTCLLALVAGAITTVDIFSHALHLTMSDATLKMGFSVIVLSRLRAIAVIGFILMGRLRDLDRGAFVTEAQASSLPTKERLSASRVQAAIHNLCSQCSAQELVEILNGCLVSQRVMLAQGPLNNLPAESTTQQQSHHADHALEPRKGEAVHGGMASPPNGSNCSPVSEPVPIAEPRSVSHEAEPPALMEPQSQPLTAPSAGAVAQRQSTTERVTDGERQRQAVTAPSPQVSREPAPVEPVSNAPENAVEDLASWYESSDGAEATLEPLPASLSERLEQAYQALVAAGKKPSGRALAQQAHVHRSTCMEWLRDRQQQPKEDEPAQERSTCEASFASAASPGLVGVESSGSAAEGPDSMALPEPADTLAREPSDVAEGNANP